MNEEFDAPDDDLPEFDDVDLGQVMVQALQQLAQMQQQQMQMMAALAQQLQAMGAPKRVVRDAQGRIVGVEPVQG